MLSNAFLFDLSLKAACTAAGLVDSAGRPTITAHRFRHTIGTQFAEGGARIQTIRPCSGTLRTPAEGPCECDLVLTCSKFLTTSDYAPRLRARLEVEQQLIDDATSRGWLREIERHEASKRRLEKLLYDLA